MICIRPYRLIQLSSPHLLDLRQEAPDVLEEDLRQLVDEHRCADEARRQLAVDAVALEPLLLVLQCVLHLTKGSPFFKDAIIDRSHIDVAFTYLFFM